MGKDSKKTVGNVFLGLIVMGLVLAVIGMFVGQMTVKLPKQDAESLALFDKDWGNLGTPSNAFAVVSYIVTIIGLVVLVVDAVLRLAVKKDIKVLRIVGAAVAVVGAILVLVSGLMMVNDMWDVLGGGKTKDALKELGFNITCGFGVWLAFIGGLIGGIAGGLSLLKQFN